MEFEQLIKEAFEARKMSWSPYSGFSVGAALLSKSGKTYRGCNIENAAFSPTNCAERTAFFKAISDGERDFEAIAVVGGASDADEFGFAYPCGVCRQVMMEFCEPEQFKIITADSLGNYVVCTLKEILPNGFRRD